MKRRLFIRLGSIPLLGLLGASGGCLSSEGKQKRLASRLLKLKDENFRELVMGVDVDNLIVTLERKGVITGEGEINVAKLHALASKDIIIVYKNYIMVC